MCIRDRVVAVCVWCLYNKTRHGKYMYAIGGNEAAAEVAGVNVYATKIRIYILASCMFGLAGCLLAAKSGGASVNTCLLYTSAEYLLSPAWFKNFRKGCHKK